MIVKFRVEGYNSLSDELLDALAPHVTDNVEKLKISETNKNNYYHVFTGDLEQCRKVLALHKQDMVLSHDEVSVGLVGLLVEDLMQRLEKMVARQPTHDQQYNQKVNVHVPGLGLLMVNEVLLLQDSCTDNLRDHLAQGWRIIAACPQPDQRRPDYVLGRSKVDG